MLFVSNRQYASKIVSVFNDFFQVTLLLFKKGARHGLRWFRGLCRRAEPGAQREEVVRSPSRGTRPSASRPGFAPGPVSEAEPGRAVPAAAASSPAGPVRPAPGGDPRPKAETLVPAAAAALRGGVPAA